MPEHNRSRRASQLGRVRRSQGRAAAVNDSSNAIRSLCTRGPHRSRASSGRGGNQVQCPHETLPRIIPPFPQSPSLEESLDALPFRQAPHNIEAEQALLGAILINNELFDRVSGFLPAEPFLRAAAWPAVRGMAKLIGAGKHASPITLKTFFDSEPPIGELTVAQYLGRLAAAATTIINALPMGGRSTTSPCAAS